jgi:hypothetical protein
MDKALSDIHLQSQLRVFIYVFSPISQHVSAPPGHPQVNHNIQLYYLKKAIVIPTDPLFLFLFLFLYIHYATGCYPQG